MGSIDTQVRNYSLSLGYIIEESSGCNPSMLDMQQKPTDLSSRRKPTH